MGQRTVQDDMPSELLLALEDRDGNDPVLRCAEVFGNDYPVEVELGIGKGRFLIDSAQRRPQVNFFGVEWARKYLRVALERCDKRGLENVRFIRADAREFVEFFLPANSVQAFHLYFPDPWPKKRHHKRRLFDDAFLREVTRTLRVGGVLRLATDHDDYFETMVEVLDRAPGLAEVEIVWDGVRTNYEDKFLAKGKQINRRVMEKSLPL